MDAHDTPAPKLDEPKTPLGLTLLGIGLLLLGAVYFLATADPPVPEPQADAADAAAAAK